MWTGADCIILGGTIIEDNCVIGAEIVVKGTIKKKSIACTKKRKQDEYY